MKVRIAAPPEDGRANMAIERLLAEALGIPVRDVSVIAGLTRAEKTIRALGINAASAVQRLKLKE